MIQKIKKHSVLFWISAAVFILVFVWLMNRAKIQPDFSKLYDPYDYAMVGASILDGKGIALNDKPYVLLPPGLSVISASIQFIVGNPEYAIKIASITFWIISTFLFYHFLVFFFSEKKYRYIGMIFFCTIPGLLESAAAGRVETAFLTVILLMIMILFNNLYRRKPDNTQTYISIKTLLLFSVVMSVSYYIRPEGLWIGFVLWIIYLFYNPAPVMKKIIASFAIAGVVGLLIFPYLVFLKNHTGRWQVSGKTYANLIMGELESPYQLGIYSEVEIPARYKIIERIIADPAQAKSFYDYLTERPSDLFTRIPYNSYRIGYYLWYALSPIGLILIIYGMLGGSSKYHIWIWGVLSVWILYLLFFILPRVLSLYHPFLIVWMLYGIQILRDRLSQKYSVKTGEMFFVSVLTVLFFYQSRPIWLSLGG